MGRASFISIAIALIVLTSIAIPVNAQVTVTTTPVRYRFASNATVIVYSVPVLAGYEGPIAVFMRDGVLYVAYDNYNDGANIVRLDTGEIVKTCSFSDYFYFETIVSGNGTAYGAMYYWDSTTYESGVKYIDLWSCKVLGKVGSIQNYIETVFTRHGYYLFVYDVYHNRLIHAYLNTSTSPTGLDFANATVIDIDIGSMRNILGVLNYDHKTNKWYYNIDAVLVTPDYYYIFVANATTGVPVLMYVFDARNLSLVNVAEYPITHIYIYTGVWYGSAPMAYNRFGMLYLKSIGTMSRTYRSGSTTITYNAEVYRIVLCRNGFNNCSEYVTDLESNPGQFTGVVAYKDVFVVHGGESPYLISEFYIIPYVHIFLPDKGLLINTTTAGFAVSVDYNLWSNNKIVVYNPANGYIYVIDPPTTTVTEIQTMIQTATVTLTTTVTEVATTTTTVTKTQTATTTATPYPSMSSSWLLPVILLLITLAVIGIMRIVPQTIATQEMVFVKKK